jgi:lipoprotein NlpD
MPRAPLSRTEPLPSALPWRFCRDVSAPCPTSISTFAATRSGARVETAPRPEPDANGLITYETYQVVVARRGDTVAQVASRVGLTSAELASFNGRRATDVLRDGEVLALPRRVSPAGGGTDIASIARGAIDEADTSAPGGAPQVQPGAEPVRHQVGRGETAYSIARLYGVSVRSLAEWNGLGPDLAVRENQYLIIPIVLEPARRPAPSRPAAASRRRRPRRATRCPTRSRPPPCPRDRRWPGPAPPPPEPEPEPEPEPDVALPAARGGPDPARLLLGQ